MSDFLSKIIGRSGAVRPFCSAVIVAAGSGTRMDGINKLMAELDGSPVLVHTLSAFEKSSYIDEIIIVTREAELFTVSEMVRTHGFSKVQKVICGGARRQDSVMNGLLEVSKKCELAAIHDGARPLVSEKVIGAAVEAAVRYNAAAPAVQVKDTIKVVKNKTVQSTPDRAELFAVQTPQVFWINIIKAAITDAAEKNAALTDDCSAVERMGIPVHITEGDYENIKITTPGDLLLAETILRAREESAECE